MSARNLFQAKSQEEKLKEQSKRNPYAGQDDITGEYCDQLYPFNDWICVSCAKKLSLKSEFLKNHISVAQSQMRRDLCRLCGDNYMLPSQFVYVHLLLGRNSFKRISRLDQYGNTRETQEKSKLLTEQSIKEKIQRI